MCCGSQVTRQHSWRHTLSDYNAGLYQNLFIAWCIEPHALIVAFATFYPARSVHYAACWVLKTFLGERQADNWLDILRYVTLLQLIISRRFCLITCYLHRMGKHPITKKINRISSRRAFIVLLSVAVLLTTFISVPILHRHPPTHRADAKDYDATCYWVKTVKANRINHVHFDHYAINVLCVFFIAAIFLFVVFYSSSLHYIPLLSAPSSTRGPPVILC